MRAQLGADLLPEKKKSVSLPALGFLSVGRWGFYVDVPYAEARSAELDDRIDVIGRGFFGLTIACARCHDHKYDPISQRDYYALAGIVGSTEYREFPLVNEEVVREYKEHKKQISEQRKVIQDFVDAERRLLVDALVPQTSRYLQAAWRVLRDGSHAGDVAAELGLYPETLKRWIEYLKPEPRRHRHLEAWDRLLAAGGTAEQARGAADDFQKVIEALYSRKKRLDEENAETTKRYTATHRSDTKTIKPGGVITYDLCSTCELSHKTLEPESFHFWRALFQPAARSSDPRPAVFDYRGEQSVAFLSEEKKARLDQIRSSLKKLEYAAPKDYPFVMGMADSEVASNVRLHIRGDVRNLGNEVPRGLPAILSNGKQFDVRTGSGRLQLAEAIIAHPLAARVMANRIWMHHFGKGIVDSPSNFGQIGERPTHPELLDYLAARFRESDWSLKAMHREIMLSATYQLSTRYSPVNAASDAGNQLYWRANRRRLDAEAIRDSLLAIGGNLNPKLGGKPADLNLEHNRRTTYGWISRKQLNGLLSLFDFPDPGLSSERRNATNVPLQSLFFLNSPLIAQQAQLLAKRLASGDEPDSARIRRAYLLVYGRLPTPSEVSMGLEFLGEAASDSGAGVSTWDQYAQALLSASEFYFVE